VRYSRLYEEEARKEGHLQRVTRRRVVNTATTPSMQDAFNGARLNYRAAQQSAFRGEIHRLGGSADAHYANRVEFWRIREYVRDFDRNTAVLGQATDRALDQCLGAGLRADPQTDDPRVNARLAQLDADWSENPESCDFSGRFTLADLERLALRHRWIDGDCFIILDDKTGSIYLQEGDRVTSSAAQYTINVGDQVRDLVHGVELEVHSGKPLAYWFQRYEPGERQRFRRQAPTVESGMLSRIPREQVIHIYEPSRATQSRGLSAFHAVFDRVSMHEDIEFAQLVQQQVSACIAAFVTSDYNKQWGVRNTELGSDGVTELDFDEFTPGMIARLNPGESISTFSPQNPTTNGMELSKQIVREIGLALGLPLELTMLVTSDTTFHGFRGAVESWKQSARRKQRWYARTLRSRVYEWKVGHWIEMGLVPLIPTVFRHQIQYPAWQYVDPKTDAEADTIRLDNYLASHRQVWAERGRDYEKGVIEIVEDRAMLVKAAQEAAAGLEDVDWRELLTFEAPAPEQAPMPPSEDGLRLPPADGGNDDA